MSSSESESAEDLSEDENSNTDDEMKSDTDNEDNNDMTHATVSTVVNDVRIDMLNDGNDDGDNDNCDIENIQHVSELYNFVLDPDGSNLSQGHSTDDSFINSIRPAMGPFIQSSSQPNVPLSMFGDSADAHLFASPLIQRPLIQRATTSLSYYLSYNSTADISVPKLFLGNVPHGTIWQQLREFFNNQGCNVSHVALKYKNTRSGFAFVRFGSIKIANFVLHDYDKNPSKFVFRGVQLRISRCDQSPKQVPQNTATTTPTNDTSTTLDLNIAEIHYGTLITRAAMRNIHKEYHNVTNSLNEFGFIAHNLITTGYDIPTRFEINEKNKKFAIISTNNSTYDRIIPNGDHINLKFEWNFRDLKGDKISPVLVDNGSIFLLIELKRPPIILQTVSSRLKKGPIETRLPGTPAIGHANGWIFKLNYTNPNVHTQLFKILRRYNLSPKQFSGRNIIDLIHPVSTAKRYLKSVNVLSNDVWVRQNQDIVDNFRYHRWPAYPFETKFEIMKLVSKHIITFHDLIVDEKAENILEQCSVNTLVACTDKIVEQAPRWFSATCDNDDDWNQENEQEKQEEESEVDQLLTSLQSVTLVDNGPPFIPHIRSSTGASVNILNTEEIPTSANKTELSNLAKEHRLGTFSRLLLFALSELIKEHELRRITMNGMYVTKHEIRTAKAIPFLIRKIYITPSSILYEGPYREEKCAVTRHFEEQQDRFLRITFRDEDYQILHNYNDNMTLMYEHIKQILIKGVTICDRKYEFLAFSSSQLREHSCWMFASVKNDVTANTIREWMGDFRNVRPVAKLAARLGQSFSTSIKGIKLESNQFREISDATGYDKRRRKVCFTDGIGIIAPWFAEKLINEVKPSDIISCPSAFQIRCGGFKGMLCVDVANLIPPSDIGVHFRDSMKKFSTENLSIDVVRTSASPSLAYLNRQIILLLSSLGIPDDAFLFLQERMLERLLALTGDPRKACESLKEFNEFGGNGCHAFLIDYLKKLRKHKEPFTRQILLAFQAFLVKELRTKAKILVPNSWSLFGVIDETRTLSYGQVFIQIDNTNQQGGSSKILQGPVVVTRNPCFHPGDIRRLEAVDIPALHKLKNVIVFPMNGPRPHAMEMSGGDLDGDTFWISQHKEFIFEYNDEPFDYQDQTVLAEQQAQMNSGRQFTIEDVCNFFGEYIEADNLGLIANSHLAFADQLSKGAKAEKCLILARMHSTAVDFAKNGVCAPHLTHELRPTKYPHYMEKKDKESYRSTTILGKLYDEIKCYKTELNIDVNEEIALTSKFPYKLFNVDGYDTFTQEARVTKNEYDRELKRVMRQYGIKHEAELVSGYILKFTSKQYAKGPKLFDLRNEITHAYRVIRDKYLRIFWEQFYQSITDESENETQEETTKWSEISKKLTWKNQLERLEYHDRMKFYEEVKQKASAWFHVTYEPWIKYTKRHCSKKKRNRDRFTNNQQAEQQPKQFKGLFSFAWIVYPVLLEIVSEKQGDLENNTESKNKKKKKKNKNKDVILPNNNN